MPYMYGLEYTRVMCDTCLEDFVGEEVDMTKLEGGHQCPGCRQVCETCGESITDSTIADYGPVVRFRDWLSNGKLNVQHASCAADTLMRYLDPDFSYDHSTRGHIAAAVELHFAQAVVTHAFRDAIHIEKNGWHYICKRMPVEMHGTHNIIAYGRSERAAWLEAAQSEEVRRGLSA